MYTLYFSNVQIHIHLPRSYMFKLKAAINLNLKSFPVFALLEPFRRKNSLQHCSHCFTAIAHAYISYFLLMYMLAVCFYKIIHIIIVYKTIFWMVWYFFQPSKTTLYHNLLQKRTVIFLSQCIINLVIYIYISIYSFHRRNFKPFWLWYIFTYRYKLSKNYMEWGQA